MILIHKQNKQNHIFALVLYLWMKMFFSKNNFLPLVKTDADSSCEDIFKFLPLSWVSIKWNEQLGPSLVWAQQTIALVWYVLVW